MATRDTNVVSHLQQKKASFASTKRASGLFKMFVRKMCSFFATAASTKKKRVRTVTLSSWLVVEHFAVSRYSWFVTVFSMRVSLSSLPVADILPLLRPFRMLRIAELLFNPLTKLSFFSAKSGIFLVDM